VATRDASESGMEPHRTCDGWAERNTKTDDRAIGCPRHVSTIYGV
jgi:hypothetical protein